MSADCKEIDPPALAVSKLETVQNGFTLRAREVVDFGFAERNVSSGAYSSVGRATDF
jgi:hypothetical protein